MRLSKAPRVTFAPLTDAERAAILARLEAESRRAAPAPQAAYMPGKNPFTRRARR